MPRDPKTPFTTDEIARSFVTAFLKTAQKELSLRTLIKTALAFADNDKSITPAKVAACQPDAIKKACKELVQWDKIMLVSPDVFCLLEFMPKYRTLDDTWMS